MGLVSAILTIFPVTAAIGIVAGGEFAAAGVIIAAQCTPAV